MRLRAPFLRLVLRNSFMELEMNGVVVFAEVGKRGLYAEVYVEDVGYVFEKGRWTVYGGDGKSRSITEEDAKRLKNLAKRLSTLPNYTVLELLVKALYSVEAKARA
ncbi:MAG: hypothetical protein ABWK05_05840 [Pyrobaculum sp.]